MKFEAARKRCPRGVVCYVDGARDAANEEVRHLPQF